MAPEDSASRLIQIGARVHFETVELKLPFIAGCQMGAATIPRSLSLVVACGPHIEDPARACPVLSTFGISLTPLPPRLLPTD